MTVLQFQRLLKKKKIDAVFLSYDDPNVQCFLGAELTGGFLLVTPKKAVLLISPLDDYLPPRDLRTVIRVEPLAKNWEKKHECNKVERLGVNKARLTMEKGERLKKFFPHAKILDVGKDLQQLRLDKSPREIAAIRKACALTSAAFAALIKELQRQNVDERKQTSSSKIILPRINTELDVALFLENFIRRKGGAIAFPTIAASGKNAAIPHHITSNVPLQRGVLLLDFGARVNGYCADMTRTIFLGKPTPEEEKTYCLLAETQQAVLAAVKEGIQLKELDKIARKKLGKYAAKFNHALGHGIGWEVHEEPSFSDSKAVVKKNVTFTIEPGLYFKNKFGLRIEDTVVWNGKKLEILTAAAEKMKVIVSGINQL